jgi:sarcosine oxidase delta subunit
MLNDSMYIQIKLKLRHCADFLNLPKEYWVDMKSCIDWVNEERDYTLTESVKPPRHKNQQGMTKISKSSTIYEIKLKSL